MLFTGLKKVGVPAKLKIFCREILFLNNNCRTHTTQTILSAVLVLICDSMQKVARLRLPSYGVVKEYWINLDFFEPCYILLGGVTFILWLLYLHLIAILVIRLVNSCVAYGFWLLVGVRWIMRMRGDCLGEVLWKVGVHGNCFLIWSGLSGRRT